MISEYEHRFLPAGRDEEGNALTGGLLMTAGSSDAARIRKSQRN